MSKHTCNFCHKSGDEVTRLIAGPNNLGACDDCLSCLALIMAGEDRAWRDRLIEALQAVGYSN